MNTSTSAPVFAKPVLPAVLKLTVTKEFFDLIKSGEKLEEYREIKPYWLVRFIDWKGMAISLKEEMCTDLKRNTSAARWNFDNNYCQNIQYSHVEFKNGYAKDAPTIITKCKKITIGKPTKQGSQLFKDDVFIISLGTLVWSNCG